MSRPGTERSADHEALTVWRGARATEDEAAGHEDALHVVLEHASSDCSDKAALTIDNALITQSANHGIAIRWGSLVFGCSNVVFEHIAGDHVFDESTEESEGGGCWCSSGDCECQT